MTELKRYEATTQRGKPGHCFCAQVFGPDGFAIAEFNPTDDPAVSSARARLFAEACLVHEETGLTPRQLVKACHPNTTDPACPDCGAVDCERAHSGSHECSSGYLPGDRKVCQRCGRMNCPTLGVSP